MRLSPMLPTRIQSWTPCRDGMSPVRSDARAGEHTGDVQKKLSKRMPRCGEAVEHRRADLRVAGAVERPCALVVADDEQDVRTSRVPACHRIPRLRLAPRAALEGRCSHLGTARWNSRFRAFCTIDCASRRRSTQARLNHVKIRFPAFPGSRCADRPARSSHRNCNAQAKIDDLRSCRPGRRVGVDGKRGAERQLERAPHRRVDGAQACGGSRRRTSTASIARPAGCARADRDSSG